MERMQRKLGALATMLVLGVASGGGVRAQDAAPDDTAAQEEAPQYKFNLAPAKNAPGAAAEVLLTPKPEGGFAAEISTTSLPDPAALKPDASTYVVWLYDPATQKKERVASVTPAGGAGKVAFDVTWPSFAIVVTAESTPEPAEWSGIAVLTGQPALPAGAPSAAAPAAGADRAAAAGAAGASAGAADASSPDAAVAADPAAGAAEASGQADGGPDASGQPAAGDVAAGDAGAQPAGDAPEQSQVAPGQPVDAAAADASAGVVVGDEAADETASAGAPPAEAGADAGVSVDASAEDAGVAAGAEAGVAVEAAPEDDAEDEKGKKRRFKNSALDALVEAQRSKEAAPEPQAEEESSSAQTNPELDAMARESRAPEVAARIELDGTGKSPDASGRIEVGPDGTAIVAARRLPAPGELGQQLNSFVLWTVDPASGQSRALGALQGGDGGNWSLTATGLQPGAALIVTAEPGPQSTKRTGPVVLAGRWEE